MGKSSGRKIFIHENALLSLQRVYQTDRYGGICTGITLKFDQQYSVNYSGKAFYIKVITSTMTSL